MTPAERIEAIYNEMMNTPMIDIDAYHIIGWAENLKMIAQDLKGTK